MKTSVFGIPIKYTCWSKKDALPLYISEDYDFHIATIGNKKCVVITPKQDLPVLPTVKKQILKIQTQEKEPVVLQLKSISNYKRQSLIDSHIAFMTDKQAYLPFLGAYLEDEAETKKLTGKFMFSTQQLFLFYMYAEESRVYISDATKALPLTSMTLTRATKQLEQTGLFEVFKDGVSKVIESRFPRRELFEKAKPFLSSPVKNKGYIDSSEIADDMVLAGVSALSKCTMLGEPRVATYATPEKGFNKDLLIDDLRDPAKQAEVELWAYDPRLFSDDGCADVLSVVLSLGNTADERVEQAIEELLEELLGER